MNSDHPVYRLPFPRYYLVAKMTDVQQDITAAFWEEKIVNNGKFDSEECWNKYPQTFCYYSESSDIDVYVVVGMT